MNILRIIPAFSKLEAKNQHLSLGLLDLEAKNQQLSLGLLDLEAKNQHLSLGLNELQAVVNKPKPRHIVFVHIPRTGGSSLWHSLAKIAADAGIPVADLYHDAKIKFSNTSRTQDAIADIQRFLRVHTTIIHHHTPTKIEAFFDQRPEYFTIIRDPVDRFVSEVHHVQLALRKGLDSRTDTGWDPELVEMATRPEVALNELLDAASQRPYFTSYYCSWLECLLLGRDGNNNESQIKYHNDRRFASYVKEVFVHIADFSDMEKSLAETARALKLPAPKSPVGYINNIQPLRDKNLNRQKFASAFVSDYRFLADLGFNFEA